MRIQNSEQLHALESAIDSCSHSVWLESVQGDRYDMKDEMECHQGLGLLMSDSADDLGLYANTREDEAILLNVCRRILREEGHAQGRKEERISTLLQSIAALADTMGWTEEQSMDALKIPDSEREVLAEFL